MDKQTLSALIQGNRLTEALALGKRLCAATPDDATLWNLLASAQAASGAMEDVVRSCDRIIALEPGNAAAHSNRGGALYSLRRLAQAEQAFRAALSLNPSLIPAGNNLGMILKDLGRIPEAIDVLEKLIADNPAAPVDVRAQLYANLALVQLRANLFEQAEQSCRSALQLDPSYVPAHNNLAQALKERGLLAESIRQQRIAIRLSPDAAALHSNLLLDLNYLSEFDANECAREHRLWGERYGATGASVAVYSNNPDPDKRLRVGYVSPDFRAHSVAFFLEPLLSAHNKDRVEVFCYANLLVPDAMTHHLRGIADQWRNVWSLDDLQLAQLVRRDGIDILVDLAGHTSGNRVRAFGRKPAPVQITWLGYPNTTGLREMDYRLTDEWADPPGAGDELHTETLIRLPKGFLCYKPLDDSPEVDAPPVIRNGYVTFGCFNNSAKVSDKVLDAWGRILAELPQSRLLLKSRQLHGPSLQKRFLDEFSRRDIDPGRIETLGRVNSTIDHLSLYGRVDIALDTFPYNGTTTTCEALWMGVPVVALAGNRHAGRVGVSLLQSVGLAELIAGSVQDYDRIAVELGGDTERLIGYRSGLRNRMRNAPLLDAAGFARDMESVYREVWRCWCKSGSASSPRSNGATGS
ncbi:MAG: tetratricopeptide repeat protein [Gammaproteobacteria bacterium]|nr:tetratricopeptide repeat protein [Gammaproteobacteria bacterium]